MTAMQYLAQEIKVGELIKIPREDRDVLKDWAAEEMKALGMTVDADKVK